MQEEKRRPATGRQVMQLSAVDFRRTRFKCSFGHRELQENFAKHMTQYRLARSRCFLTRFLTCFRSAPPSTLNKYACVAMSQLRGPWFARGANLSLVKFRLMAFLAILGPGFITANVDNDPGGILTYSQAGAKYGYTLLWTLIPTTIALIVVQEMAARMGAVTGKGLSDLIREEFGLRATFITMAILGIADFGNIAAEFAGIASGMGVFGVSKYFAVPVGAALVWIVIVNGRYKPVERMLILFSLIYFTYPVSAFLAKPDWKLALHDTLIPQFHGDSQYLVMIVGLIGTTITPWMQFYLQASIVEKGVDRRHYALTRLDVILGCVVTDVIAFFIVVACAATIYKAGGGIGRGNHRCRRRRPGAEAFCRTVRQRAVRRGIGERVAAVRRDSAAGHRLQRLRRSGLRIRHRPALFRGADFLLAVHAADRGRRGFRADSPACRC